MSWQDPKSLILGGVRSGKSQYAERLAFDSGRAVTYIATATAADEQMRQRIENHRLRRPDDWHLVEEPIYLAAVIQEQAVSGRCVIVDCLTLWLTNLLTAKDKTALQRERDALLDGLPAVAGQVILVSNETSMGVVPMDDLSRQYCDEAGRLHQSLAAICDHVAMTVAGIPQRLKGASFESEPY